MKSDQIELILQSWNKVMPNRSEFARNFYANLFQLHPDFRFMFKGSLADQENMLLTAIGSVIAGLKRPYEIVPYLRDLGSRHAGYGVKKEYFEPFITTFLETMRDRLGPEFSGETNMAWREAFRTITEMMIQGLV